ncbi:MAG: tetratricopeptide repeat protein [Hydrogenobaculum sp.]
MKKKKLFFAMSGLAILLSSCAEPTQQGPNPIAMLQQQYQYQQQEINEINRRLDSLDESLAKLRVKLGLSAYNNITKNLGESEPQTPPISSQTPPSPSNLSSLPAITPSKGIKHLSNTVTIINSTAPSENQNSSPNLQSLISNTPQNPQELYGMAYRAYQSGDYQKAKRLFKEFILKNPHSKLTNNAYYWLGMTEKAMHHNSEALAILLSLIDKCRKGELPSCDKAPSAYFSAANIYKEMGQKSAAINLYKELIKLYPDSIEAALARSELEIK